MESDNQLQEGSPASIARLTPDEWSLQCATEDCETIIADVAWIDINYNMATNVAESQGSAPDLADLPAPHLRRYRMGVMFPFDWKWSKESKIWELEGSRPTDFGRLSRASRVVRGNWSTGELGQLGAPPFFVRCWNCGALQSILPLRRKGTPPLGQPPRADTGPRTTATAAGTKGKQLPVRPLYGAVVTQRPRRRYS
jgi:hypothetical protein